MMLFSLLLLVSTTLTAGTPSFRVTRQASSGLGDYQTEPRRALAHPGESVTLLGKAGVPLKSCHFYLPGAVGRLVDLSRGAASTPGDQYEYVGSGLDRGECGIRIKHVVDEDDGIVECKVRPVSGGGWTSCVSTLRVTAQSADQLPVFNIEPRRASLGRGDSITITCNVDHPITLCHIFLPGGTLLNYDRGADSESTSKARYHGSGLEDGQCGVTLTGVDPSLNGYIVCKVGLWPDGVDGPWETDALKVTTSFAPSTGNSGTTSRPPPKITTTPPTIVTRPSLSGECPPLISNTVLISCLFAGERVDCTQPHEIGTTATIDCKPGHVKVSNVFYRKITCKRGGMWDRPLFECTPECGRRKTNRGDTLIAGGQQAPVGEFPWHVGVYQLQGETPSQVCGGSLITPNVVISAAHCFWDEGKSKKNSATSYKVAAGKHFRSWEDTDPNVQKRDVSEIELPTLYRGRLTNFAADLALVRVKSPFEITAAINIICVDWENELESRQLYVASPGLVTGWGYTEENKLSNDLRYVQLPYVAADTCIAAIPRDRQSLFTPDKFCAGYLNQSTSVCGGDSGGGLVFKQADTRQHYLRGVVSVAFSSAARGTSLCYSQLYTGFVKFSAYRDWIRDLL